jgi:adenine-specific DNA-methyltransferase
MDKMRMHTVDITDSNIEKIGQLFPNCLTERIGDDGKVERVIDFDQLRQELSKEIVEGPQERYQFTWPDKKKAIRLANSPSTMTLRPCREESVDFDNTENLYIEGDNLEVLKLLREDYLGKVKMIYIDPPYNTGNDFVYEDDFSQSVANYAGTSGQIDALGNRLVQNTESSGRFHTDWLNMIYPRLRVAKDFLKDDGVIFISIDDTEVSNLRKCCDEVFGAQNFVADLIWQKKFSRSNDATYFSTMHDHILCYCKNNIANNPAGWKIGLLPRGDEIPSGYTNPDNDPRGVWTSVVLSAKSGGESLLYPITLPSGRTVTPPSGRYWSCSKDTFEKWKADNRIWFGQDGDGMPRKKTFLSEVQEGLRPNTIIFHTEGGHNQEGKQETKQLFDGVGVFDGPKPVRLLFLLLQIAKPSNDDLIMDFFSGSATTAHAVEKYNATNETHLKYILVQLPEETEPSTEANKAGFKNICEIGKERIRRAGKRVLEEQAAAQSEGGLFTQTNSNKIDVGFRVLKLDSSNMEDVYYRPEDSSEATLFESNVKEGRSSEDLLFQVMLECNLPLSAKIQTEKIEGKEVFTVNNGYLIACFDDVVSEDVIKAVAKRKPYYFIMRDSSLASDNVADNFEQIFQAYSKDTIRRIL